MTQDKQLNSLESLTVRGLPSYDEVIKHYDKSQEARNHAHHNHSYWRWIHGGLALVKTSPLSFDPRKEYWWCTERRLLVAFFASRFQSSYAPAAAMRSLAFRTFLHFQRRREDGAFGEPHLATRQTATWPEFCDLTLAALATLPEPEEYQGLRKIWGRMLRRQTLKEELTAFLEEAKKEEKLGDLEPAFFIRLAWFPYMGLRNLEQLVDRQRFFYGFYQLFASTNSYVEGGGMNFAPVLQNNPTDELIRYAERWAKGETPHKTGFVVEGKTEKKDRSHHMPVVELYGFLNLHRVPFYNGAAAEAVDLFVKNGDASIFDAIERLGLRTRQYLDANPRAVPRLARLFRDLATNPPKEPVLTMEGIRLNSVIKKYPREYEALVEHRLVAEMNEAAVKAAQALTETEAATAMLHLLLDAWVYGRQVERPVEPRPETTTTPEPTHTLPSNIRLPSTLATVANDALGYLRAGYHVLFAGPPGTGKTTLAQLIGYAWNNNLETVPEEIDVSHAPVTTVGNSAWSPFHTIGGILPDTASSFSAVRGIFIDPEYENEGEWQLRPNCLVLDEMNRADLDRCIGELYPLLSGSVERVYPAGISGVHSIRLHPRFRIVATVNDTTLDDIVFPISEGLARRFIRFELLGATTEDLEAFLSSPPDAEPSRLRIALDVLRELQDICASEQHVTHSERGVHLPFGVGYFASLGAWIRGKLKLSTEFLELDDKVQARQLVITSLGSAIRARGFHTILEKFRGAEEEA